MKMASLIEAAARKSDKSKMVGALPKADKKAANAALVKAGLDGNGRFGKVGDGIRAAFDVLAKFKIEPDTTLNADLFLGDSGTRLLDLARSNENDPTSPGSLDVALSFQWYKLDSGKYEIVAYVT